jgi:DNA replication protein DnaC
MLTTMDKNQTPFNDIEVVKKFAAFACATIAREKRLTEAELAKEPPFILTKNNTPALRALVKYFAGIENQPGDLDLRKGIILKGPTGTGKTTIMRLFSLWLVNKPSRFRMVNCRDIQREAAANGFEALYKYTKFSYHYKNGYHRENGPVTYCLDDLGAEDPTKFYGQEINVIQELIQDRYNEYQMTGMITHATTNINDGNIYEKNYGIRVRDRLREMFNFVELNGQSFRR